MDKNLSQIKTEIYDKCALELSDFKTETESKAYNACRFQLNGMHVLSRNAKKSNSDKSNQPGLIDSISCIFFLREPFLICFSLEIALKISVVDST